MVKNEKMLELTVLPHTSKTGLRAPMTPPTRGPQPIPFNADRQSSDCEASHAISSYFSEFRSNTESTENPQGSPKNGYSPTLSWNVLNECRLTSSRRSFIASAKSVSSIKWTNSSSPSCQLKKEKMQPSN